MNAASPDRAVVVFGDVIGSRHEPEASSVWLRSLSALLNETYPPSERRADFGFTQGDELQGLLVPAADPFRAVLIGALHEEALPMRWVVVLGEVAPGSGPATERGGPVFVVARDALADAKTHRERFVVVTGEPGADHLLGAMAPILGDMLAEMTGRQRTVARLMLIDGLRQADVAERLGVSRATISVAHARGHVRSIARLVDALRSVFVAATRALEDARSLEVAQ